MHLLLFRGAFSFGKRSRGAPLHLFFTANFAPNADIFLEIAVTLYSLKGYEKPPNHTRMSLALQNHTDMRHSTAKWIVLQYGFSRDSSRFSPTQSPGGRLPTFGHLVFATPKSTIH